MFRWVIDEEIYLKILEKSDAKEVGEVIDKDREYLKQWLGWLDGSKTLEDRERFIEFTREEYKKETSYHMGMFYKNKFVGMVSYNIIDRVNGNVEIGYWLASDYQGYGIITRVCRGITENAFDNMGINRVEIRAATENRKSRAVAERLGFEFEGVKRCSERLYDTYVDHAVYSILESEKNRLHKG